MELACFLGDLQQGGRRIIRQRYGIAAADRAAHAVPAPVLLKVSKDRELNENFIRLLIGDRRVVTLVKPSARQTKFHTSPKEHLRHRMSLRECRSTTKAAAVDGGAGMHKGLLS